ncbi:MAG: acetyl-CoA carboxylase biotin carboxylase subunit [Candidatus Aminicenantes bacterium]|nr:acetyl-CoA carboxylase biotin carboxylase subunit [Candidatus Aminicenantes bacterium]NIM82341.1 acetyl-CoA carboxylase biotin carboxylase subunit [Candidatus Aminicenantes bacterium]NIN21724.1 acetyl-CoA carboxylase biotin carboxylase subunit [Candidatus Aminicenantes bacterium]NIN45533.1 acetyl-CoA carboxylase biotin carboxylase subunit [Candidatus Aminicenantes bacterium]NIN88364.1 acetyl-CoA carboxylase biotin carboxylase subunit [Candidatus Aminicenantes bacterium]
MISKILIANRGEIAVRIIRAAKELGLETVLVYSQADEDSLGVKLADHSVCIGPPPAAESYLFYQNIISAALAVKADAIHPGYGFLAENWQFADACRAMKIRFIGPRSHVIRQMGDKAKAKALMKESGVPVVPGSDGIIDSLDQAYEVVEETGFPVMLKASAGGGGKGMRIVCEKEELEKAYNSASTEAQQAFADSRLYIEKYIASPKHIEVQVLGDKHGNVVHLFERDCSIQRRHQKLVEEAPSAGLDDETRDKMGGIAVKAAQAVGYDSAGTIEFLYDIDTKKFYFMEMNTRIQVEHPVSEAITGVDLIKYQFRIANGEKLDINQEDIQRHGHSLECRINAEDPERDFSPAPGTIHQLIVPGGPGVRVDSAVFPGYTIPPFYDSMVAKLITWGTHRRETVERMKRALDEFCLEGIKTTIPFHKEVMRNKEFLSGQYTTDFVSKFMQ